jgi:hypothetical protein
MNPAVFSEVVRRSRIADGAGCFYLVTYRQPKPRRWLALAYHHVWERLTWRTLRYLEGPARARHAVMCERLGGCADTQGEEWLCDYIPWTNRQDDRCFHLMMLGRTELTRSPLSPEAAKSRGWPD